LAMSNASDISSQDYHCTDNLCMIGLSLSGSLDTLEQGARYSTRGSLRAASGERRIIAV